MRKIIRIESEKQKAVTIKSTIFYIQIRWTESIALLGKVNENRNRARGWVASKLPHLMLKRN